MLQRWFPPIKKESPEHVDKGNTWHGIYRGRRSGRGDTSFPNSQPWSGDGGLYITWGGTDEERRLTTGRRCLPESSFLSKHAVTITTWRAVLLKRREGGTSLSEGSMLQPNFLPHSGCGYCENRRNEEAGVTNGGKEDKIGQRKPEKMIMRVLSRNVWQGSIPWRGNNDTKR